LDEGRRQKELAQPRTIVPLGKKREPNAFLEQLKFDRHLEKYDVEFLVSLVERTPEDKCVDKFIAQLHAIAIRARYSLTKKGHAVLMQLNRRKAETAATTTIYSKILDTTLTNYVTT
jgi:hypothetical protein